MRPTIIEFSTRRPVRRAGVLAALLALLAGCDMTIHVANGGDDVPDQSPTRSAVHEILYDVRLLTPGYALQVSYTDENGRGGEVQPPGPEWTKTFSTRYPDVPELFLTAAAVPDPSADPTAFLPQPNVQCILWVDGNIADQSQSSVGECHAKLTDTVQPPTTTAR